MVIITVRKGSSWSKKLEKLLSAAGSNCFLPANQSLGQRNATIVEANHSIHRWRSSQVWDWGHSRCNRETKCPGLKTHFDSNFEIEYKLSAGKREELISKISWWTTGMRLHSIRQTHPRGLGERSFYKPAFVGTNHLWLCLRWPCDDTDDSASHWPSNSWMITKRLMLLTIAVMPVPHEKFRLCYRTRCPGADFTALKPSLKNQRLKTHQGFSYHRSCYLSHRDFLMAPWKSKPGCWKWNC